MLISSMLIGYVVGEKLHTLRKRKSCNCVIILLGHTNFLPFSVDIFSWNENGYFLQFLNMMNSLVDKTLWVHVDQKHNTG